VAVHASTLRKKIAWKKVLPWSSTGFFAEAKTRKQNEKAAIKIMESIHQPRPNKVEGTSEAARPEISSKKWIQPSQVIEVKFSQTE
jgi:hypothetical protein